MKRLENSAPTPNGDAQRVEFGCSVCDRVHVTLARGDDGGPVLRFNPEGLGIEHVRDTIYRVYCPDCATTETVDMPLPPERFADVSRHMAELFDERNWHPFGAGACAAK